MKSDDLQEDQSEEDQSEVILVSSENPYLLYSLDL